MFLVSAWMSPLGIGINDILVLVLTCRLALRNTLLIREYFSCHDVVRPLVCVAREWVRDHGLGISSYAITNMVISFLEVMSVDMASTLMW